MKRPDLRNATTARDSGLEASTLGIGDVTQETQRVEHIRFSRGIRPNQKHSSLNDDINRQEIPPVL
jgi:hypothetical protein